MTSLRRAGRLALYSSPLISDWCNDHAAQLDRYGACPGPAFDLSLAERSVTIRAAYAFGDWPPAGLIYDSPTRVAMRPPEPWPVADWMAVLGRSLDGYR